MAISAPSRVPHQISLADINDGFSTEGIVRIALGRRHWIDLKRELNYGDRTEIESISIRTAHLESVLETGSQRFLMLALYVAGWSFTDPYSQLPIQIPSGLTDRITFFRRLTGRVGEAIRHAVEAHHQGVMAEEAREEMVAQVEDPRLQPTADEIMPAPKMYDEWKRRRADTIVGLCEFMNWTEDQLNRTRMSTVRAAMRRWTISRRIEQQQAQSGGFRGPQGRRR